MSFSQDSSRNSVRQFELDGSDGQDRSDQLGSKSQADYLEDLKAHLAEAHSALRYLTGATLEDMISDPGVHPAYVGCVRELLGFGLAVGHGHGHGSRRASAMERHNEVQAGSSILNDLIPTPPPADLEKMSPTLTLAPPPISYVTIHFLPDGAFNGNAPSVAPSVFDQRLVMFLEGIPVLGEVSIQGHAWTRRGDLIMAVYKPPHVHLSIVLFFLDSFHTVFDDNWRAAHSSTYRLRPEGETCCYLRIHDLQTTMFPEKWWTTWPGDIRESLTMSILDSLKIPYVIPSNFHSRGAIVSSGKNKMDCFIDLFGMARSIVESLRRVCPSTINSLAPTSKPFMDPSMHSVLYLGDWKSRYRRYNLSISFLELRDEIS